MADAGRCVYCHQRPIDARYRPFCSERCRMADLGRWLRGDYRVPGSPVDEAAAQERPDGKDGTSETGD